jgi:hypothetical protein
MGWTKISLWPGAPVIEAATSSMVSASASLDTLRIEVKAPALELADVSSVAALERTIMQGQHRR